MDRLTRKELKSDRFALEVQHGVEYVSDHRRQLIRWGSVALAVAVVVLAVFFYRGHEHQVRQAALREALRIQDATIGPAQNEFTVAFPTQADRDKAVNKAFTDLATKYSGSDEGIIAEFYLGTNAADQGKIPEAEKRFKIVVDSGNAPMASLAKLALAQVYGSEGKVAEGEKLLQSVIDHPTVMVSKEQATVALGELIAPTDPLRARKLLEPLRSSPRAKVSQAAISALSDLPQK